VLNLLPAAPLRVGPLMYLYVAARAITRVRQNGANAQTLQFSIMVPV
jgi:hypothetical protein